MSLYSQLKNHDWYYGYSDDHRVWKRGLTAQNKLTATLQHLNCPYGISDLRKAVQEMVVEEFVEENPDCWYRYPRKSRNIAPVKREDLLHRADQVQILAWIELQDIS